MRRRPFFRVGVGMGDVVGTTPGAGGKRGMTLKKALILIAAVFALALALAGCSQSGGGAGSEPAGGATTTAPAAGALSPGKYSAVFDTDSSMFHINESCEGRGVLTVADDGTMTIHVPLASKKIVNVFCGTADEAKADGAAIIEPTTDTITYKDGYVEDVYAFDIPVPALGEEFDVAILGEKGKWYDHKVSVSDPAPVQE